MMRLVDTWLECMQYLAGIARIRNHYRSLSSEAVAYFAADNGKWPEAQSTPAHRLGRLFAYLGTTASMIAFINNVAAGAGVTMKFEEDDGFDSLYGLRNFLMTGQAGQLMAKWLRAPAVIANRLSSDRITAGALRDAAQLQSAGRRAGCQRPDHV